MDEAIPHECYFGELALNDAVLTGENQILLTASCLISDALKNYIIRVANSLEVVVTDCSILLPNGAELFFLVADSQVISGYSGNAYAINCFDDINYSHVSHLVSGWTILKKHRAIFFSIN